MKKLNNAIVNKAGWAMFLPALVVYLVFGFYIMPHGLKTIEQLAGHKVEIMDLQITGYTPERAREIIGAYTPEARQYAANFNAIADSFYPIAYTFLYIASLAWIFKALAAKGYHFEYLVLFPVIPALVDYGENIFLVQMLRDYPAYPDKVARVATVFTSVKWILAGTETLMVLAGALVLVYFRLRRSN